MDLLAEPLAVWPHVSDKVTDDKNIIVVDTIAPEVSVEYSKSSRDIDGKAYYNGDVEATITVKEANFYATDVVVKVSKNGAAATAVTPTWTTDENNGDIHYGKFTMTGDGHYIVTVEYTDKSDNFDEEKSTYTSHEITIDTIKPVINVEYQNKAVANTLTDREGNERKYFADTQTAVITINEHNFISDEVEFSIIAKDVTGAELDVATLNSKTAWSVDSTGDVHTITITYPGDANYTFDVAYTDKATNAAEDYATDYFTVDKTDPTNLTVSYSTSVLDTVLESVTFGFYNAKMTVTLTAEDPTSEIHSFLYSYLNAAGVSNVNAELINEAIQAADIKYSEDRKTATVTFEIPKMVLGNDNQFNGTVEFTATDRAGNETDAHKETKRIVVDNIAPTAQVSYNEATNVVGDISYYKRYCPHGKVAVLNFANPENPGGGVQLGAMAQEECLCRSSNLYTCISNPNVFDEYYGYHRSIRSNFYTDRLIYTKNVTVFKDDSVVPQMLPETNWFDVDVITCAAPYLAKRKHTNGAALFNLFKSRVKNIFEAARDNNVDYLILGAFGCGAFKNPPLIVAEAFLQTIKEQNYLKDFKQIVFAIKPTGTDCPNLSTFSRQFDSYAPDAGERCVLIPESLEWRLHRCPALPTESRFSDNSKFSSWQMNNNYFGKQFSILGDSISTLDGFNPKGYKIFYTDDNCVKSGVAAAKDTWWDKVIGFFGGELLVNNSWSGSRVTKLKDKDQLFPSGCSDERTAALHINDVKPDVILVYLGTNDWAFGSKTGNETRVLDEDNNELFDEAYDNMLKKIMTNYPKSEVWCCTLCETYISKRPDFKFPHQYAGIHIEEYNEIIRDVVRRNDCRLIDLYDYKVAYDSIDGSHPTNAGMNTIATMVIRSMVGFDADQFLDCEDGQHEYKVVELRVPLGAKKGMMKCEMLIMQLYPWLSITETSTNTVSSTLNIQPESEPKAPAPATETVKSSQGNAEKKGFFSKLFGKK